MTDSSDAAQRDDGGLSLPTLLLIVGATVLALLSSTSTWVRAQAMDTDEWVRVSTELLAEPEVQDALAVYVVDELFGNVDIVGELAALVPEPWDRLLTPFSGVFRDPAVNAVERVVASDRFADIWETANRTAHAAVVATIRGEDLPMTTTSDGTITLHLRPAVIAVGEDLGLPAGALERIPEDAATLVVLRSDDLARVQATARVLDTLSWFLFVVVVAMYAAAIWLARDRWPRALQAVGLALVVNGVALLLIRRLAVQQGVNLVVSDPTNQAIAAIAADLGTQLLRDMAIAGVGYGVIALLVGTLLGHHPRAVRARGWLSSWAASLPAVVGTAVLAVLALLAWSPGRALERWVTAVTLLGLAVTAIVTVAVVVRRDEPPATN